MLDGEERDGVQEEVVQCHLMLIDSSRGLLPSEVLS